MAVYEHLRKYVVVGASAQGAQLSGPKKRAYWTRFLSQSVATDLFKRALKVGDKVVYKRVSNSFTTFYKPVRLVK